MQGASEKTGHGSWSSFPRVDHPAYGLGTVWKGCRRVSDAHTGIAQPEEVHGLAGAPELILVSLHHSVGHRRVLMARARPVRLVGAVVKDLGDDRSPVIASCGMLTR